jgi:NADH-quinone oxidoreductase subunit A
MRTRCYTSAVYHKRFTVLYANFKKQVATRPVLLRRSPGWKVATLMSVVNEWAFIGVFMAVAWVFPSLPLVISWLFRPRKANAIKMQTYECGVETVGDTWVQFKVQYYIYGLVFLVFDVELIFLFPWALAYNQLNFFAFGAGLLFIFLLADALIYAWRKNALEWA